MIKSLLIKNFQSHKDTHLEFDKGVNVIVGPSDSGKSAIIRAIRWITKNRPTGSEMNSHWGGKTRVELETNEDFITRIKGASDEYYLNETVFCAFKTDVPEEIQNALNLSDINIQHQLDSHFLLSKSSGEVASYFNKIAKLSSIDTGIQTVKKWISEIKQTISFKEDQKKKLEEQLKTFDYLDKFEIELELLEESERRLNALKSKKERLMDFNAGYYDLRIQIDFHSWILQFENLVNTLLELYRRKEEKEKRYQLLYSKIDLIKRINKDIKKQNQVILIESKINKVLEFYKTKEELETQHLKLSNLRTKLINVKQDIRKANDRYNQLNERYTKNFPEICPLCNTNLKHKHQ